MNTAPITVEKWSMNHLNQSYVSVTFCIPGVQGSSQCTTVDHMVLDTGSVGVRVMASALGSVLADRLPAQSGATDDPTGGAPIAECAGFGSGYTWGSIKRADVTIGGKTAGNLPVQVYSDNAYATPSDCVARGVADIGTVAELGANGIVGIGSARRDYAPVAQNIYSGVYYCTSSGSCKNTRVPLDTQVMNPVANFTSDNNGTIIRLPALPADGKASVTGELVFGVGTRQNNALPSDANIIALNQNSHFTATYKGRAYTGSIDSGTNFNALWDTTIPYSGVFYTPPATLSLSAILKGVANGATLVTVPFSIANGWSLIANQNAAYNSLATPYSGGFIFGLPFFFGRSVYTVLDDAMVDKQSGPFIAF
ncbi:DUF3443 family protein [Paraburkholderia sediminicola]|uniref:DUF3443 family protein n=2 Tax=Paraburkholderia sediminicola TaxID=458836 RepID=UPI0038BDAAE1